MSERKKFLDIRELPSKIIITIIIHILTAIGGELISVFAAIKIANILRLSATEKWLLITAISALVLAFIFYMFRKRYAKNIPQFDATLPDFDVLEREFTHQYIEKEKIIHTRRYKVRALRNGLEIFYDKFFWTGGKSVYKTTKEGHRITPNGNRNLYEYYIYHFDRSLKKGDIIEMEVEWELYGPHKCFMSTPIEEPTEKLIMTIIFPLEWNMKKIIRVSSGIQASKIPSESEVELKQGRDTWIIPEPKLFHHYEMKWILKP
jgi:hypothetical protein